ncbi:hypothetical protein Glove_230g106 [Diversispora epigaea]|uniref:Uncharacterized protein n=1 Tax=Diversispora epigaea TaxID=1348612 RepID=A0A397IK30_9GLOM|nr:hypothetical protein Glove_230g106 [Diversispora epigaea]
MRAIIQKTIEEYNWLIFGINVLNSSSLQKIESADEVYELLSQVFCLQKLYAKYTNGCSKHGLNRERNPTHVLLSKFIQLLEEENEENLVKIK